MNPVLLDTNAYSAFKRGHAEALLIVQRAPWIAISTTILGELLGGFAVGTRQAQNCQELDAFLASPRVRFLLVDRNTAEHYGALFASIRMAGTPIPTNDLWIAASALEHSLSLFTFDAHFNHVPGLRFGASLATL